MIAAPYRQDDTRAAVRHQIKERLCRSSREVRAVAAIDTVENIARSWRLSLEQAELLKQEARREVREMMAFEEAAFERE
jgi:hypothetical protein